MKTKKGALIMKRTTALTMGGEEADANVGSDDDEGREGQNAGDDGYGVEDVVDEGVGSDVD
jgi:hypothetical protein